MSSTSVSINRSISQCKETQTVVHHVDGVNAKGSHSSNVRLTTIAPTVMGSVGAVGASIESGGFKAKETPATVSPQFGFKERAMSFSSVTEEDEEPISFISNRCHYVSVSEEDKATSTAVTTLTNVQQYEQQSVITEQPTSASEHKLQLDLMLASKDINEIKTINTSNINTTLTIPTADSTTLTSRQNAKLKNKIELNTEIDNELSPGFSSIIHKTGSLAAEIDETDSIKHGSDGGPMSLLLVDPQIKQATTKYNSEDSDEYRSLEAKDDGDFLISE